MGTFTAAHHKLMATSREASGGNSSCWDPSTCHFESAKWRAAASGGDAKRQAAGMTKHSAAGRAE